MRLGKLEKYILKELKSSGKPELSSSLAFRWYNAGKEERDYEIPTRSVEVSIRRAIHSLENKNLVLIGYKSCWYEKCQNLLVWLPEHESPTTEKRLSGKLVEAALLSVLEDAKEDEIKAWISNSPYRVRKETYQYDRRPGDVPLKWTLDRCAGILDGRHYGGTDGNVAPAMSRAIRRMKKQGKVEFVYGRKGRILMVRLLNVAL